MQIAIVTGGTNAVGLMTIPLAEIDSDEVTCKCLLKGDPIVLAAAISWVRLPPASAEGPAHLDRASEGAYKLDLAAAHPLTRSPATKRHLGAHDGVDDDPRRRPGRQAVRSLLLVLHSLASSTCLLRVLH